MKKKVMFRNQLFLFIMFMLLFMGSVNADDLACTPTQLSELRRAASNIKVTYVPTTIKEQSNNLSPETGTNVLTAKYLDIKIYNVADGINIKVSNSGNNVESLETNISSRDIGNDGAITLRQSALDVVVDYTFEIYSLSYGCSLQTLRTIKLTLPRYNFYSQLDACSEIADYYLCQEYTTFEVDGATFYDKVAEYKKKLESQEIIDDDEDNTGVISKTMSTVSKYKYFVVGLIVVIGVVITIFILKRKRSVL